MKMQTREFFSKIGGKRISVIGAERSGIAAAQLIRIKGGLPFVSDKGSAEKLLGKTTILKSLEIDYEVGVHSERVFDAEFIVVSPGVPSNSAVVKRAVELKIPVISEVEFAYGFAEGKIISITGTNGKTTVASLIEHLLFVCGLHPIAAGNIGYTFSQAVMTGNSDIFYALETSSFQLDHTINFKPAVAAILNITPDHLNRYQDTMQLYVESKYKIFKNMTEADLLIVNADDSYLAQEKLHTYARILFFSLKAIPDNGAGVADGKMIFKENGETIFEFAINQLLLKGKHNVANVMAAVLCVLPFIKDQTLLAAGLRTFAGVEHRIELVKQVNGVKYYNDSKATNVDSVYVALESFEEPLYLILGGQDKGNDYSVIENLVVRKVNKIYAIGDSAEKVFKYFHQLVKTEIKPSIEEVVIAANNEARAGEVVLLSPACASFDMFENFEHRGRMFKEAVEKISG